MNNAIKLSLQLFFLSVPLHILCMDQNEQQEYQNQCLIIRQKHEQKLEKYQNELKTKSLKALEQEKNNLEEIFLPKKRNLFAKTLEHHKIDTILCNKDVLLTSLDIHYCIGCSCITETKRCRKKMPIFLTCYNDPDTALSMLELIPQQYYNNFTLQDYEHIYLINMYHRKLAIINQLRPLIFMQDACETLSILRNLNPHIPQNK